MFEIVCKYEDEKRFAGIKCRMPKDLFNVYQQFETHYKRILIFEAQSFFSIKKPKLDFQTCRFCNKSSPLVSFMTQPHVISKCLGNKDILSDHECDTCNHYFGHFEDDLFNFLGLSPILMYPGNGKKTFDGPFNYRVVRSFDTQEKKLKFELKLPKENIDIISDGRGKSVNIRYFKKAYTPFRVYKALMKISLGLIPPNLVEIYRDMFSFLFDSSGCERLTSGLFQIFFNRIPGPGLRTPRAIIYEKKDSADRCLTHIICFYFLNNMIQIQIPYNEADDWLYDETNAIRHYSCPPLLSNDYVLRYGNPTICSLNLQSDERTMREPDSITFRFGDFDNAAESFVL